MNNVLKKFRSNLNRRNAAKNIAISIVILIEIIAIAVVASFAWVETVSSIKIKTDDDNNGQLTVSNTYVLTDAEIGTARGTIDLDRYFKKSGGIHLAPASSADGTTMFFPKVNDANVFRKGNASDKNTNYLSISFRLRTDTNADFFFEQVPTFSARSADIRVSVTAHTLGVAPTEEDTKIYAMTSGSKTVVNTTSGGTKSITVESFNDHKKRSGSDKRLFAVAADETKIVTINLWLQKQSGSGATDLSTVVADAITISNFGITSDLTPRHVTLLPTPTWDISGVNNQNYYAWCWMADLSIPGTLYKLELDENEHYSFDYNGKYDKALFIRCDNPNLTTANMSGNWSSLSLWNKTEDTAIPSTPVDPTYIIETINGGSYDSDISANKSTGSWHDPATIKLAFVTGTEEWGNTLEATSYVDSNTSTHVIESTNPSSQKHKDTVHAWPGKKLKLKATKANNNFAFVGWFDNAAGTGTALSTDATFETNAPSTAIEKTYYAKFKEVRTIKINKFLDGASSTAAIGTITIGTDTSANNVSSFSKTFDKDTSVSFSARATATGYSLSGIYTTQSGNITATSPVTMDANKEYWARFTTNKHRVTASAIGSTGSEVQVDTETKGTSSYKDNIKYNTTVTLKAYPAGGYEFVGWYNNSSGTGTALDTGTTYTYTHAVDRAETVYAKFRALDLYLTGYLNGGDVSTGDSARQFSYDSATGNYTLSYKFTGGSDQYVTIFDGTNAYHPGSHPGTNGQSADTSLTNTTPAGSTGNKWKVDACKGTTVLFTWNHSTKTLSWSIVSRELYLDVTNWGYSNAKYSIWVNNDNAFTVMTKVSNTLYKATITNTSSQIVFVRMNGETTANSWNYKWDQTTDLSLLTDKDKFTIAGYSYGSWSLS